MITHDLPGKSRINNGEYNVDYECIIIGGGASGLMLAAALDLNDYGRGLILEKTSHPGTKLLMSGGGHCNITHGGMPRDFVQAYGAAGKALRKCLYRFSNRHLISRFAEEGLTLADEAGRAIDPEDLDALSVSGRIFPASGKSADVLDLLIRKSSENGWDLRTDEGVSRLEFGDSKDLTVTTGRSHQYTSRNIVIATGGVTLPETGSDGSMFGILESLGISIVHPVPALAPVYVHDYPYSELSGISVPDVTVSIRGANNAPPVRMTGDMLFTHRGFSGPVILNISRYASAGSELSIDYSCKLDDLPGRLRRALQDRSRGRSGDIKTSRLTSLLKDDRFTISGVGRNGMVTAGGISLDEIDTKTMMIRKLSGFDSADGSCNADPGCRVYVVGEAVDIDGMTGGYNLQMCWSTAYTAAESIGKELMSSHQIPR